MKTKTLIRVDKDVTVSLPPTESLATKTLEEAALTETRTTCEDINRN